MSNPIVELKTAWLDICAPEGQHWEFILHKPVIMIGRRPDNDLVLPHASVSRSHARLTWIQGNLYVEDLGSANGLFRNGARLLPGMPQALRPGDALQIGAYELSLFAPSANPSRYEDAGPQEETESYEKAVPAELPSSAALATTVDAMPASEQSSEPHIPAPEPPAPVASATPAVLATAVEQTPASDVPQKTAPAAALYMSSTQSSPPGKDSQTKPCLVIEKTVNLIGRGSDCDLVLHDSTVSTYHACLRIEPDGIYLEDLGSTNGTFIRGQPLIPHQAVRLPFGEPFRIGQASLHLQQPAAAAPQASGGGLRRGILYGGGAVLILALLLLLLRGGGSPPLSNNLNTRGDCESKPMQVVWLGGQLLQPELAGFPTPAPAQGQTPAGVIPQNSPGILSFAFLELPFPYDGENTNFGGSDDQFRRASQVNAGGNGGRVNSFFDHLLPIYPAPKDPQTPGGQEPADPPIGQRVLAFDGHLDPYLSYSGHPGYDYSTYAWRLATTPLFAAADGIVDQVGIHQASGALFVKIRHKVIGVGDFQTVYWHLEPDAYFDAMKSRVGQPIQAGTRLGTMGNTGWSTGHHLHFEVRFDQNQDGVFSSNEVVDPYGWVASGEYPGDPWAARSGPQSIYLWAHPLGVTALANSDGGGLLTVDPGRGGAAPVQSNLCAPEGALPPGSQVTWSWAPDPWPEPESAGIGQGCVLAAMTADGKAVESFEQPVQIRLRFSEADLAQVDPETLKIYWKLPGSEAWQPLDTQLDLEQGLATAFTRQPGRCSLRGKPLGDVTPPRTEITLEGPLEPDGVYSGAVWVTLHSQDDRGVSRTIYSLDAGETWLDYRGPFLVEPTSDRLNVVQRDDDFLAGQDGVYLVLAAAEDTSGNHEDPPAQRVFAIQPGTLAAEIPAENSNPVAVAPVVTEAPANIVTPQSPVVPAQPLGFGPDDFPANVDPLSGMPCQQPEWMDLPPAMISVTNFPLTARPQAGLSYAPYVFELFIGEGMTRFLALFHCNYPPAVDNSGANASIGPIRSGRLPYESLRLLYNGFLVMASASSEVKSVLSETTRIYGSDKDDINSTLISISQLRQIASQQAARQSPPNLTGNRFDQQPPPAGQSANSVWVFYSFLNQINWVYDPLQGAYLRFQDPGDGSGKFLPATDRLNGEQLAFENVIILVSEHQALNSEKTLIQLELLHQFNRAYLFRDGKMYPIYWSTLNQEYERATGHMRPIRFVDKNQNPVALKPGQTWVEIVDVSAFIQEQEAGSWKVRFYAP